MNGFVTLKRMAACILGGVAVLQGGCSAYRDVVDPCYPERYSAMARHETYEASEPQKNNGHVLEQTVWNYQFEPGTDRLTAGGAQHLAYLVRRRPAADPMVYVQTSQDLTLDSTNIDRFVEERNKLDAKRVEAVRKALTALNNGRPQVFEVLVHDPHEVSQSAVMMGNAIRKRDASAEGALPSAGGGAGTSTSGQGNNLSTIGAALNSSAPPATGATPGGP